MEVDESVDELVVSSVQWDGTIVCRSRFVRTALVAAKSRVFAYESAPRVGRTLAGGASHPLAWLACLYALCPLEWA